MANQIVSLEPRGINSTMFTQCCRTAINDNQKNCPRCDEPVVGHDETSDHARSRARWANATRRWKR